MKLLIWNNRGDKGKWIQQERNAFRFPLEVECIIWTKDKGSGKSNSTESTEKE